MGFRIEIDGSEIEGIEYDVQEASSPLSAGDSSGGVGSFTITFPTPDPYVVTGIPGFGYAEGPYGETSYGGDVTFSAISLPVSGFGDLPFGVGYYGGVSSIVPRVWGLVRVAGPEVLIDRPVRIKDSRKGFTLGTIAAADMSYDGGTIALRGSTRLSTLNVYGIQAQPFVGSLRGAFEYYLGLAGVTSDLFIEDDIADRPVVIPGWTGELWYYLKLMAAAEECDISLVSGVILVRAIRKRVATQGKDTARSASLSGDTLAQSIEVYQYNNRQITNELVYPPGGWNNTVDVLNVNAGETTEYTLELSASVSSIQTPVMQTSVAPNYQASSVYTIVANDGLPVSPSLWSSRGGKVEITIDPDTTRLHVKLTGATDIPTSEGEAAQNFSLALGSDTTGNRYSTLRIVGTGVAYEKRKVKIRTGVPASKTATEVGVTIDNPFISTKNQLYSAGTRAAKRYAGPTFSLSGSVTAVNRRGDTGQAQYPTYGQVQQSLVTTLGTPTYGSVQDYYRVTKGLTTYESIRQFWFERFRDDDVDQVFGNVQGARIYDKRTRRWYRIRSGRLSSSLVSFDADDDLTHGDVDGFYSGKTYQGVYDALASGAFTYAEVERLGLFEYA